MIILNHQPPQIMHIDLDSCFATIEQQANPLLRDKLLVVAAYNSPNGCILSPSIEAKKIGIKVGMRIKDARLINKNIVVVEPDPPKYRDVHQKIMAIFNDYSPLVTPRSIDEAMIDFSPFDKPPDLIATAEEIKTRIRSEIGEWISCSIGIAPNRFLAKLGASLHKPNALNLITGKNLLSIYQSIALTDLYGINLRYQARLNAVGIFTPIDFLNAQEMFLKKMVFKSIVGRLWYQRLRGFEVDAAEWDRKSFGNEYSLQKPTADRQELSKILMKLCEKMGRRLRRFNHVAYGIHIGCLYHDFTYWHKGRKILPEMYTTHELFENARLLLNQQAKQSIVRKLSVSCFALKEKNQVQLNLLNLNREKTYKVAVAVDQINDRYGEFSIVSALMMDMDRVIVDRIAFAKA